MAIHDGFLRGLDEKAFLGFRVWEFSFKSLFRRYSHTFFTHIMLKHPYRTIEGCLSYRRFLREGRVEGDVTTLIEGDEEDILREVVEGREELLVGLGFCLKPMGQPGCPSGRPNHDCLYLARLDLQHSDRMDPLCQGCTIRILGTAALRAGAHVNVMTSALDIAHDIMIPAIERGRFRRAILFLCPLSIQAIALPLLICGIQGLLVAYRAGNCLDYDQWLLADGGLKRERTRIGRQALDEVLDLLGRVGDGREEAYTRFQREGNIYVPRA
jgi:hypothetical protein